MITEMHGEWSYYKQKKKKKKKTKQTTKFSIVTPFTWALFKSKHSGENEVLFNSIISRYWKKFCGITYSRLLVASRFPRKPFPLYENSELGLFSYHSEDFSGNERRRLAPQSFCTMFIEKNRRIGPSRTCQNSKQKDNRKM